jgi:5'/3'-nucleotidase SurE
MEGRTGMKRSILISLVAACLALLVTAGSAQALNILLSNDDGWDSYGITAMKASLEGAGHSVYLSAPADNQSGKSGSINSDYGGSVAFTEQDTNVWAIEGTPADSVSAGLFALVPDGVEIDLLVTGANDGENVSLFTNASGTVGAAMFGLRRGVPAIAVSVGQDLAALKAIGECPGQYPEPAWYYCYAPLAAQAAASARAGADTAVALVPTLINAVLDEGGFPAGYGLNVNVPSGAFTPKGIRVARSDNAIAFDLVIVPDGEGGLVIDTNVNNLLAGAQLGQVQCQYLPPGYIDYNSEGQAFACGYTTVSIVDGNIDASQDTTDQAKELACSLDDLATIEIFNCDGGDGPKKK